MNKIIFHKEGTSWRKSYTKNIIAASRAKVF